LLKRGQVLQYHIPQRVITRKCFQVFFAVSVIKHREAENKNRRDQHKRVNIIHIPKVKDDIQDYHDDEYHTYDIQHLFNKSLEKDMYIRL
jgi:hypothetical protein